MIKLNPSGSALVYSTFLGGSANDEGYAIALDDSGNAYVTGFTESTTFPATTGAFDETLNGFQDAFVSKLNATGDTLLYSTFLGGSTTDKSNGIAVDAGGFVYVTGDARPGFPTTTGAFDTTNNGSTDVFVSKLNVAGDDLVYSTFLGGGNSDQGFGIAVDASGNAYVTGRTDSTDFPTATGAFDDTHNGSDDVFVSKLNDDGSALLYSTFLGGSGFDQGNGIAVDASGSAYVTGLTDDTGNPLTDFPTTAGAFAESHNGSFDVFVSKIIPINDTVYWNLFNIEGESEILAQYATYATLTDMLADTNRTGTFTPDGGGEAENIVGSGSDGTFFWNLFNPEGESTIDATYGVYDTLGDMLNDTNRLAGSPFTPNVGGEAENIVGSGSNGTTYWNLINPEGEFAIFAQYATYATLTDMLTDENPTGTFDTGSSLIVGSGSDGTSFWNLFNTEGEFLIDAFYVNYANLNDMLAAVSGPDGIPDGGGVGNNIVGSGATNQLSPVAVAGPDQTVNEGDPVTLDGSASLPDPNFLNFVWIQVAGSPTVTLTGDTTVNPTFTAPAVASQTTFTFALQVDIGGVFSNVDEVEINVEDAVVTPPTILEVRVDASSDDAEEKISTGNMDLTSTDLEMTEESSQQRVGIRFNNLVIPPGATITNAYVQFQVDETDSETTDLSIQGELTANAVTFVDVDGNITDRPLTGASVDWAPNAWNNKGEAGPDQQTPDITSVIQEIVSQGGWLSGNSLVIIINGTGKRTAESFDGDSSGAPLLHVEFTD